MGNSQSHQIEAIAGAHGVATLDLGSGHCTTRRNNHYSFHRHRHIVQIRSSLCDVARARSRELSAEGKQHLLRITRRGNPTCVGY